MNHFLSILFIASLSCVPSDHPQAGQQKLAFGVLHFGAKEVVNKIQDLEGTSYKLSHKHTLYFFLAGVYLSDDGYVLQDKTAFNTYYPLSEEKIKELQRDGLLPSPMPAYSISIWEYLIGYSLWLIIAGVVAAPFVNHLLRRLMGKRFCPSCKSEMTPHEAETNICAACSAPLRRVLRETS
jgi:hypothetical protein